jgi:hypothetical protein
MIYFCVKFQKDPLFGVNLTFVAPWLPWQRPPFEFFQPLKSCHTLRRIFLQSIMKFDERNPKCFLNPPFLFPWQLQQSLSNRSRLFLAYLVPLDVDVAPIKFHQFLAMVTKV